MIFFNSGPSYPLGYSNMFINWASQNYVSSGSPKPISVLLLGLSFEKPDFSCLLDAIILLCNCTGN